MLINFEKETFIEIFSYDLFKKILILKNNLIFYKNRNLILFQSKRFKHYCIKLSFIVIDMNLSSRHMFMHR